MFHMLIILFTTSTRSTCCHAYQRKLSKEETTEVERLLSLKANKKMVKNKLEQISGKIVTLKDISNISTKQGHKNTRNDLTETVRKLTERYGTLSFA